jgi:hypothetical protein
MMTFWDICCLSVNLDSMFLAVLTSLLCILQEASKAPDSWFELKVNTHVYVTGLPDDVTAEEVSYLLSNLVLLFYLG